jgi:hypothetical protein
MTVATLAGRLSTMALPHAHVLFRPRLLTLFAGSSLQPSNVQACFWNPHGWGFIPDVLVSPLPSTPPLFCILPFHPSPHILVLPGFCSCVLRLATRHARAPHLLSSPSSGTNVSSYRAPCLQVQAGGLLLIGLCSVRDVLPMHFLSCRGLLASRANRGPANRVIVRAVVAGNQALVRVSGGRFWSYIWRARVRVVDRSGRSTQCDDRGRLRARRPSISASCGLVLMFSLMAPHPQRI